MGEFDYYVRTTGGTFSDGRHEFTTEWQGVAAAGLSASHFANPKLEIETAAEHEARAAEPPAGAELELVEEPAPEPETRRRRGAQG